MKRTIEAWIDKATLEKHCLITGATGSGKSVMLSGIATSLIRNSRKKRDCSIVILEPHADLASRLMTSRYIDDDRLVYISSTMQRESGCKEKITPVFNPFQLPKDADETFKSLLATQLTSAIIEMVEGAQYGITLNMEMILRPIILVTLSSPNPCLATVRRFLSKNNEDLVALGKSYPHPQIQGFFKEAFHSKHFDATKAGLAGKLDWFLNDVGLYDMLNNNGVDLEECLDSGKVIIFNTPRGANPFIASLVGRLAVAYLFSIILRREAQEAKDRVPCYLIIDEFSHYVTTSLAQMLYEARKYKLSLILSGHTIKGLPTAIKTAITTNTFLQCLSICDADTKKQYKAQTGVSNDDLDRLEPMVFLIAKNDGMKTKPFRVRVKILSKHLFLNKEQTLKRLRYQIAQSWYKKVSPPPPATPSENTQKNEMERKVEAPPQKNKQGTKKEDKDNPFSGSKRAF